jgi:hypothetical protein
LVTVCARGDLVTVCARGDLVTVCAGGDLGTVFAGGDLSIGSCAISDARSAATVVCRGGQPAADQQWVIHCVGVEVNVVRCAGRRHRKMVVCGDKKRKRQVIKRDQQNLVWVNRSKLLQRISCFQKIASSVTLRDAARDIGVSLWNNAGRGTRVTLMKDDDLSSVAMDIQPRSSNRGFSKLPSIPCAGRRRKREQ